MADTAMAGTWKLARSENFDAYLKELDVPWPMRKAAEAMVTPTQTIEFLEEDKMHITIDTGVAIDPNRKQEQTFKAGEEFEHKQTFNAGIVYKATAQWEEKKLVIKLEPKEEGKGKAGSMTRELVDGEIVQTMQIGDVTCKRIFAKVE